MFWNFATARKICNCRIVNVADLWEEVVLNLKVETSCVPVDEAAFLSKVDGGFDLMNGPFVVDAV